MPLVRGWLHRLHRPCFRAHVHLGATAQLSLCELGRQRDSEKGHDDAATAIERPIGEHEISDVERPAPPAHH
jgi:hypothetical protein